MPYYSNASDWAAAQSPGSPNAKLVLLLMALHVDKGEAGVPFGQLARQAEMSRDKTSRALELLESLEMIGLFDDGHGCNVYAPKWLNDDHRRS